MAQELSEMKSLEGAMADLQEAKNGMNGEGAGGRQPVWRQLQPDWPEPAPEPSGDGHGEPDEGNRRRPAGRGSRQRTASYNDQDQKSVHQRGRDRRGDRSPPTSQSKGFSSISIQGEIETNSGSAADALTRTRKCPRASRSTSGATSTRSTRVNDRWRMNDGRSFPKVDHRPLIFHRPSPDLPLGF